MGCEICDCCSCFEILFSAGTLHGVVLGGRGVRLEAGDMGFVSGKRSGIEDPGIVSKDTNYSVPGQ